MVKIEAASETVAEGESVVVTVTLDQAPERAVTVPLTITPVGTYSADDVDEPLPTSVEFLEDELLESRSRSIPRTTTSMTTMRA